MEKNYKIGKFIDKLKGVVDFINNSFKLIYFSL